MSGIPKKLQEKLESLQETLESEQIKQLRSRVQELENAGQALIDWLNGYGRTNKPRRGRVPAKLLDTLEQVVAREALGKKGAE